MSGPERLQEYLRKRDLERSPEPDADVSPTSDDAPIFVIQKHDASSLHYDFRLQVDDVLASWAVPKGPSTDPSDRRLALRTEDHPLEYAEFEGMIPDDEYGGGLVLVWDAGPYRNLKENEAGEGRSVADCIEAGHLTVWLEGEKLRGGYALTRTGREGERERWLLVKMDDDEADARRNPVSTEPCSVLSGRSAQEIRDEQE